MTQPEISRWEGYWQRGDWRRLLSIRFGEVLTLELQNRIVTVYAQFPWWGMEKVYDYLRTQGVLVTQRQVRQAAQESGWSQLRQELVKRYHLNKEVIRPRDEWLVGQLLAQIQLLLAKVEAAQGLTEQQRVDMADTLALADDVGLKPNPAAESLTLGATTGADPIWPLGTGHRGTSPLYLLRFSQCWPQEPPAPAGNVTLTIQVLSKRWPSVATIVTMPIVTRALSPTYPPAWCLFPLIVYKPTYWPCRW